jgi:hypothetical protein
MKKACAAVDRRFPTGQDRAYRSLMRSLAQGRRQSAECPRLFMTSPLKNCLAWNLQELAVAFLLQAMIPIRCDIMIEPSSDEYSSTSDTVTLLKTVALSTLAITILIGSVYAYRYLRPVQSPSIMLDSGGGPQTPR